MTKPHKTLDVRGMTCPMPLIHIQKETRNLQVDEQLCIVGDDPIFEVSIADFCEEHHLEILDIQRQGRVINITLHRKI